MPDRSSILAARLAAGTLVLLSGCGDGPTDSERRVSIRPVATTVAEGAVASFVYPAAGLTREAYSGTVGAVPVTFGRLDDSTVAVVVPAVGAASVPVRVKLDAVTGEATLRVSAGEVIADPAARVGSAVERAMAAYVRRPHPAGYGTTWSSDSATIQNRVAEGMSAFAALSPADQLEVARLLGAGFVLDDPAGAATQGSARRNQSAATAEECRAALVAWERSTAAAEELERTYLAASGQTKKLSLLAIATLHYAGSVIHAGGISQRCTFESGFSVAEQSQFSSLGKGFPDATAVWVRAGHWTRTIPREATGNPVSDRLAAGRRKLERLAAWLGLGDPLTGETGRKIGDDHAVHPSRVTLTTTEVVVEGTTVRLGFAQSDGDYVVVRVLSTLRQPLQATLTFAVVGGHEYGEAAPKQFTATVTLPPVCHESGDVYRGCVDRVEILPTSRSIGLHNTYPFTPRVWDHFGDEVTGRPLRWASSTPSVATVTATGAVTGVAEGEAVITAVGGESDRKGIALVTVVDIDSTAIYEQAVLGRWTVGSLSSPSSTYPWELSMEPTSAGDGWRKAAYLVPAQSYNGSAYCPNLGTPAVDGTCHYPGSWRIERANGRYYLMDSGFWHPAYGGERRDPLTMPVGSFVTYSNYSPDEPSRTFSR